MLNTKLTDMPSPKSDRPKLERGSYPGIINLLIDLGEQRGLKFGQPDVPANYETKRKLWIGIIFPTESYEVTTDDGDTFERYQVLGKEVTLSNNEKAKLVEYHKALCKPDSPVSALAGAPCLVAVDMTSNGNPKVGSLNPPMKGTAIKMPKGQEITVISEDDWDSIDDADLPPFLIDRVNKRVGGPAEAE